MIALAWLGACVSPSEPVPPPPTPAERALGAAKSRPWVALPAGTFKMGSPHPAEFKWEEPQHEVRVPAFEIMKHEILSVDYHACVQAGPCSPIPEGDGCTRGRDPRLPQNCLNWDQARAFCGWIGARLPSESEWEYAATSGGRPLTYPWGDEPPDCSRANTMYGDAPWCPNAGGLWKVCSHPAGDTPLGLCEMGGNAFEWVEDWFWWDYADHPTDGSAQSESSTPFRSMRGGGIGSGSTLRSRNRTYHPPDFQYGGMGARCARSVAE